MVSSNVSSECWVLNVPALSGDSEDFAVEEPDDEKNFSMIDQGTVYTLQTIQICLVLTTHIV